MARGDVYTLRKEIVIATAITALQLKAGANHGFEILEASVTQRLSETSVQEAISLLRKTVAATVTAAIIGTDLFKHDPNAPNPELSLGTAATGHTATAEGTDGDEIVRDGFNVLNGWSYQPVPSARVSLDPDAIIGLTFKAVAPSSQTWLFSITIQET